MKLNIFLLLVGLLGTACERHSASTLPVHGAHGAHGAHAAKPEVSQPAKQDAKHAPSTSAPANAPAPKFFEESGKK